ncbi:hypothetical protein C4D60_Mb02t10220 [Musa balbisiana]|uniref:Thaumatin-like protein n=1 Tax=Musa balbisiana TaxID=52838 RepID=A0A4S8I9U7_MUSBA|nr:hypothetical protein C4D60_Mb02t10220 [Musa balbisiana]
MAAFLLKSFLLGLGTFLFSGALRAPAAAGAGTAFILENNCPYTVWPGALSGNGAVLLGNGSFELPPNATSSFSGPPGWSGRFWARTSCLFDSSANGSCATGDCGGALRCSIGGAPPVSLAEFTLGGGDGAKDFYDVSLVDGYNVGIGVRPSGAAVGGSCRYAGCVADVNARCPAELRVASESGETMACRSAVICRHLPSPSPSSSSFPDRIRGFARLALHHSPSSSPSSIPRRLSFSSLPRPATAIRSQFSVLCRE